MNDTRASADRARFRSPAPRRSRTPRAVGTRAPQASSPMVRRSRCKCRRPCAIATSTRAARSSAVARLSVDFIIRESFTESFTGDYTAGGGASGISGVPLMVRLGRPKGPGGNSPNGVPALAQPIAVASSHRAWRYFRISSARACRVLFAGTDVPPNVAKARVASGSPASNSVITITRCRRSSSSRCCQWLNPLGAGWGARANTSLIRND